MKKFNIDISDEKKKKEIYFLFDSFKSKSEIYKYYGVSDNTENGKYLRKIGEDIGFDFSVYAIRKKPPKKYCIECGKELIKGQKKFCCASCSAKFNNKNRKRKNEHNVCLEKNKKCKEFDTSEILRKEKLNDFSKQIKEYGTKGKSKIFDVPIEILKEIIKYSITYTEVLRCMGFHETGGGGPWRYLKKRLMEEHISIEHFKGRAHGTSNTRKKEDEEIYIENSNYTNRRYLKIRLIKDGYKNYSCECCGLTEWMGKPISLQLHHINGINNDNRLENLQLLCPNCHSQTDNYCGKNIYNKDEA